MFAALIANWKTVVVLLIVILITALAIIKIIRDRKKGIGPCGKRCCDCANSAYCTHK
jgi:hypothetical protein